MERGAALGLLMRRFFPSVASVVLLLGMGAAAGCSDQGAAADASSEYRGVQPGPESGTEDAETDGGPSISTTLRLANMSPDLGQVDFCWRIAGAAGFTGPVQVTPVDAGGDGGDDGAAEGGSDGGAAEGGEASTDAHDDAQGADAEGADGATDATLDGAPDATLDAALDAMRDAPTPPDGEADGPNDGPAAGPPVQVGFAAVSPQVQLPSAGTLDLALVAPNQLSCGSPLFIGRVTLDAGKSATVTIMGLAGVDAGSPSALQMVAFVDEPASMQAGMVRFIHAALGAAGTPPAPPLSARTADTVLAPEVDPGGVTRPATTPPVDPLGYATFASVTMAAPFELDTLGDAAPHTWVTGFLDPGVRPGTAHTGFIVSLPQAALGIVWCGDVSSIAGTSSCQLLTAR